MKQRVLEIKHKGRDTIGFCLGVILFVAIAVAMIVVLVGVSTPMSWDTQDVTSGAVGGLKIAETQKLTEATSPHPVARTEAYSASGIKRMYENAGSPIADEIPWLVAECEARGLNPELVAAVMALESGWGKSCPRSNCFGWGMTDSGDMGYGNGSFEQTTTEILNGYANHYNVDTAQEMASLGYNFHASWVSKVNQIISYF